MGLRIAAVSGGLLLLMMWAAEWPLLHAGNTWGFGRMWAKRPFVARATAG